MKTSVLALFALSVAFLAACGDGSTLAKADDSPVSSSEVASAETSSSAGASAESSSKEAPSSSVSGESSSGDAPASSAGNSSAEAPNSVSSSESAPGSSADVPGSSDVGEASSSSVAPASSDDDDGDDGKCTDCDSYTAADPTLTEKGGKGSVTTYGSVTDKETSLGGACNYGQTNIQYYAAIHVNVSPGDDKGPWNGGAACGGCVRVKAKTPDGWKRVTVPITDRCPDANCGVDLGGAPAADIMVEGVWGDSTSLWVKEGASSFWSIVHVRNPKDMVNSITIYEANAGKSYELEMVVGTENFWTVPPEVLQTENRYRVVVKYRTGTDDEWHIKGSELAVGEANLYLHEHRE